MELTQEEEKYLKIYKGVDAGFLRNIDIKTIEPLELLKLRNRHLQLYHKNINMFLNFINNPDAIDMQNILVEDVSDMVNMIKALINIACKSSINYHGQNYFYRYENIHNLSGYENGYISSFKSSSWNTSSAYEFKKEDTVLLNYNCNGFCPFIPVDKIIDSDLLADEHEFLIPPYLDCSIEGDNVEIGFFDKENIDETDYNYYDMMYYFKTKDSFNDQFKKDKDQGIVSDELREYCENISQYLSIYARLNYRKYEEFYNMENDETKTR